MKKKGFTLIELLAVIVVLAIIALIATPIVMNTIKRSQKGAAERSADNYIEAVETAVATSRLDSDGVQDGTYTINDKGNLTGNGLTEPLVIEMSGNKPKSGTITIRNGQVETSSTMTIGSYEVAYNPTNKKYEATEKDSSSLICDLQEGVSQTVGAKYTCHLDSDRTFYVLETSGDNVSLIMDRNFTDDTVTTTLVWCIDGEKDNTTCKNINSTEEGTPLKHIQDTFGSKVIVSFPTYNQINEATGNNLFNLPIWLSENLSSGSAPYGYWLASPHAGSGYAWCVDPRGDVYNPVDYSGNYGVRPVITVSKSNLA